MGSSGLCWVEFAFVAYALSQRTQTHHSGKSEPIFLAIVSFFYIQHYKLFNDPTNNYHLVILPRQRILKRRNSHHDLQLNHPAYTWITWAGWLLVCKQEVKVTAAGCVYIDIRTCTPLIPQPLISLLYSLFSLTVLLTPPIILPHCSLLSSFTGLQFKGAHLNCVPLKHHPPSKTQSTKLLP